MPEDINTIKQLVDKAEEILVLLPQNPGPDSLASALALHIGLKQAGKHSSIACGTPLDFNDYPLRQAADITQKIGNKNLVISLKIDQRDSVDKVSYNLDEENKVFNLVISPKKGVSPLSSENVSYSLSGARADLIFLIGAASFEDLGSLYVAEPALFTDTVTVAINRLEVNPFAKHHLNYPQASSIAEYMTRIFEGLGLRLDAESSSNLLAAIDVVTDKLQLMNVTANTFEAVAKLMRAGGIRIMMHVQPKPAQPVVQSAAEKPQQLQGPIVGEVQQEDVNQGEIPQDWLEPKIYKAPKGTAK